MADIYDQLEQSERMVEGWGSLRNGVPAPRPPPPLTCDHCGRPMAGGGYGLWGGLYHLTCIPKAMGYKGPDDFLVKCNHCGSHHPQQEMEEPEGVGRGCLRAHHQRQALRRHEASRKHIREVMARELPDQVFADWLATHMDPQVRQQERARILRRVEDYWWR